MTAAWAVDSSVPLLPDAQECDLRDTVRAIIEAAGDIEEVRRLSAAEPGYSEKLWRELVESMAVTTMAVPESAGGLGFGLQYLCGVVEECGRGLRPEPVLSTAVIGVPALLAAPSADVDNLRSGALGGDTVVGSTSLTGATDLLTATHCASGWVIDGSARVIGVSHADVVVATAWTDSGRGVFAIQIGDSTISRALESIDPTRPLADLECSSAPATLLADPHDADAVIRGLRTRAITALAAENVGIAERLFEMTLEYTNSRRQFGRTIASFQAIKHRLADMFLDVERARSAARYAAALFDDTEAGAADVDESTLDRVELAASVAGVVCGEAVIRVATESIQLHGGIGFTWEHSAHSYYRRALTNETLFGSPTEHRQRIAMLSEMHPADD